MPRATSPVVGTVLLVAIAVLLSAVVGAATLGVAPGIAPSRPVALSLTASADADRIAVLHEAGPPLDVRELRIRIAIDGTPLAHQPPVPFFTAVGFRAGPTGPFNSAADPRWEPGERASLRLAGTNAPTLVAGAAVTVRISRDDAVVAVLEARAR